jgi:hypothetical protein
MNIAGLWPADSDRYHAFTIDYQTIPSLAERARLLAKHPNDVSNEALEKLEKEDLDAAQVVEVFPFLFLDLHTFARSGQPAPALYFAVTNFIL